MVRTVVLVSGGGTNLQAIIDARLFGQLPGCDLCAVISSNSEAYALERAKNAGIPAYTIDPALFPNRATYTTALLNMLKDLDAELVVLAGYLLILDAAVVRHFPNRIINIHPALVPAFSGDGCYGLRVHEKALEYGVKLSGATAHFVTEGVDEGPVIMQKAVEVLDDDTPMTLQRRIMEQAEWEILPKAVGLFCEGRISVDGRRVRIAP